MSARLSALLLAAAALAPALAAAEPVAIINARIETAGPAGAIARGTLVMDAGKIVLVGTGPAPAGARVIDAAGRTVSPGLILASTSLGVAEIEQVPTTRDDGAGPLYSAAFDLGAGVNPDSPMIALARLNGVTRAVVTPIAEGDEEGMHIHDVGAFDTAGGGHDDAPGLFAGQASVITLAANQPQLVVKPGVGVVLEFGEAAAQAAGGSRGAALLRLRELIADARKRVAARGRATDDDLIGKADAEALAPVLAGRAPLLVRVSSARDIRTVLALASAEKLRVILERAEEAWRVAPELARAGVPVILDPQANLPASFESLAATLENPAILARAGVQVAVMGSRDYNNLRQARLNAGAAVAYGLPYQTALQAVTLTPARIWGMERDTGSLEVGKTADVVVWSGDPLEAMSYPTAVFIAGVEQKLESRSTALRDRYRPQPPGAPPPAYRR
jgi:imidazolonepropionase-like amidohydrolase